MFNLLSQDNDPMIIILQYNNDIFPDVHALDV